jgi:acyl-CoA thioesterase FadM
MTMSFEIYRHGTDDLLATGEKVDVCVILAEHKPVTIPAAYRQALERFEGKTLTGAA